MKKSNQSVLQLTCNWGIEYLCELNADTFPNEQVVRDEQQVSAKLLTTLSIEVLIGLID